MDALLAIARNAVADHLRRLARSSWEVLGEEEPESPALHESEVALMQALERLPASQRQAFELLQLQGLSVTDAAALAGTSRGALKVRAHRAYKALRAMFGG